MFSALWGYKSLRKPSLRGVFPFTYTVYRLTRTTSHGQSLSHKPRDLWGGKYQARGWRRDLSSYYPERGMFEHQQEN